ncbi:MAG: hypothetical protein ACT4P2_01245 [Pseudomonadota bacterium]
MRETIRKGPWRRAGRALRHAVQNRPRWERFALFLRAHGLIARVLSLDSYAIELR